MERRKKALRAVTGIGLAMLLLTASAGAVRAQTPPDVLVITNLGDTSGIVSIMQGLGWNVTTASALEADIAGSFDDQFSQYDVIWLAASADYSSLRAVLDKSSALTRFTAQGGIVVLVDVAPDVAWLDIAPGGLDAEGLPTGGAGSVTVSDPNHAVITGAGTGGVALTVEDLDPTGVGGSACLVNAPQDESSVVIAQNDAGPVLLEHTFHDGTVIACALKQPSTDCAENILRYVESLVQ